MTIGKIVRERTKTSHVLSKICHVKVTFPVDLEVKVKAVLLCAALTLVKNFYFELVLCFQHFSNVFLRCLQMSAYFEE